MIMRIFKYILITSIILIISMFFLLKPIKIDGNSMYPAFKDGDWILVNRAAYIFSSPKREDVVAFRYEGINRQYLIKRIVGLEYETIEIIWGSLYINSDKFDDEEYARYFRQDNFNKRIIPKDHFFVLGDNRKVSVDSRYEEIGFINMNDIIGKIIFKW